MLHVGWFDQSYPEFPPEILSSIFCHTQDWSIAFDSNFRIIEPFLTIINTTEMLIFNLSNSFSGLVARACFTELQRRSSKILEERSTKRLL